MRFFQSEQLSLAEERIAQCGRRCLLGRGARSVGDGLGRTFTPAFSIFLVGRQHGATTFNVPLSVATWTCLCPLRQRAAAHTFQMASMSSHVFERFVDESEHDF